MIPLRLTKPPHVLTRRSVQLDNIAVVPASLLPFKKQWQALANALPRGGILLCSPAGNPRQRTLIARMAAQLRTKGLLVRLISEEQIAALTRG